MLDRGNVCDPLDSFLDIDANSGLDVCLQGSVEWNGVPREADSILSALRTRRAGHGSRARARDLEGLSPGRLPLGRARRRRERPRGRGTKTCRVANFTGLYIVIQGSPSGSGMFPGG